MGPRRREAVLALAVVAVLAQPSPVSAADVVGGEALGSRGVVVTHGAPAFPGPLSATAWIIADLDSGEVIAAKDAHGRYAPASTLKMLTAVALIPELPVKKKVVPTFDDVAVDGSKVGLVERVGYPVAELFRAMLMVSANDAANTLATSAGGLPRTAGLMNAEATRLQARDTRAVNPSGLDATGQVSSPYDLALIARAGMAMPDFRAYAKTMKASVSGPGGMRIETYNHNKLLRNYDGAIGIKNGYTVRARASFVGAATRGDRTLVVVAMKGNPDVWRDVAKLLDWGFVAFERGVKPVGQLVEPLPTQTETPASSRGVEAPAPPPSAAIAAPLAAGPGQRRGEGQSPALPAAIVASALTLLTAVTLHQRRRAQRRLLRSEPVRALR